MAEVDTLSSSTSADAQLTADGLFLEITRLYGDKTASAFTMYVNLDSEDARRNPWADEANAEIQ